MRITFKILALSAAFAAGTTSVMGENVVMSDTVITKTVTTTTTVTETTIKKTKNYFTYKNDDYPVIKKYSARSNYFCFVRPMGLGIGFIGTLGAPDKMNTSMGRSVEIDWHLISFGYKFHKHNTVSIGFGLLWRNFRMVGPNYFSMDEKTCKITPEKYENGNLDYSRIHTFAITIPILYRYKWDSGMQVFGGAQLAFNTYGSVKSCAILDGQEYEYLNTNVQVPAVNVDIVACVAYKWLGLYMRYSPMNVLDTDYGPKFQSITAGMRFVF